MMESVEDDGRRGKIDKCFYEHEKDLSLAELVTAAAQGSRRRKAGRA